MKSILNIIITTSNLPSVRIQFTLQSRQPHTELPAGNRQFPKYIPGTLPNEVVHPALQHPQLHVSPSDALTNAPPTRAVPL